MSKENKQSENNPFGDNFEEKEELKEENTEETKEEIKEETEEEETKPSKEEALQAELDSLNNKYLRLAADFDNFRKRQMQERESLLKYGAQDTLKKIITVLDTFERAEKSIANMTECEKVKESYAVGLKQLYDTLDKIGLKKIQAKGETFDPNLHEAVMQTPTNDYPVHTIIDELQAGYMLFDKVLRASLVNVATEGTEVESKEEE